ncbi:MAG: glycosyltransferase [Pseudomonadota bacterium]
MDGPKSDPAFGSSASDKAASDHHEARYLFGRDTLGPGLALYLLRLHGIIFHASETLGAKPLFVARAGIRIRRLLRLFCERTSRAYPEDGADFFTSRFMTAKGAWPHAQGACVALLEKEFSWARTGAFATALLGQERVTAAEEEKLNDSGDSVAQFLASGHKLAAAARRHLDEQAELFGEHLQRLLADGPAALLIDTGWQGTAQTLLSAAYPDTSWWGAYIGRSGFAGSDRTHWERMMGLVFEADSFDPARPETAIVLHRHVIESLFEPQGPSVERMERGADGLVHVPAAQGILADAPDRQSDPIFTGVCDHIEALTPEFGLASIEAAAQDAWRRFAHFVVYPDQDEVAMYLPVARSADFGRELDVPVLKLPDDTPDQTPDQRISEALWPAGQAAVEYPEELARPVQRRIAGIGRQTEMGILAKPKEPLGEEPAVAVITRTLDRPMFLRRALMSVHRQSFRDFVHVIVCDGGPIDDVRQAIAETPCDQSKILLVDNVVNRGMEAASNAAIAASRGRYLVIHDDDDTWEADFLADTVSYLEGPKGRVYGGVVTHTTYVSEKVEADGIHMVGQRPYQEWVERISLMEMAIGNHFAPIAFLFRRDLYDALGGYNENYPVLGDWDFNLRFLLHANIGILPRALANYHHRDVGDTLSFGNSVIADRSKHSEYDAIVRNDFVRLALQAGETSAAQLVLQGQYFGELRGRVRNAERYAYDGLNQSGGIVPPTSQLAQAGGKAQSNTAAAAGITSGLSMSDAEWLAAHSAKGALELHGFGAAGRFKKRLKDEAPNAASKALKLVLPNYASLGSGPPDFDEARYLEENPDVKMAVERGDMPSGYAHWLSSGHAEGRLRPTLV